MSDLRQYFGEHNPFWRTKGTDQLAKREYYFYTHRRRTPGLMGKISLGFIAFTTVYGAYAIKKVRAERERGKVVAYEFKRKSLPFVQAVHDRQFLAVKQRMDWLEEELFKNNPEELRALKRLYHDPMMWTDSSSRGFMHMGGVQKSYKNAWRMNQDWLIGHDSYRQNEAGSHY